MSKYSEKFKDPRWQRKRLEIFRRDEWTCQMCLAEKITLNVHHKYYDNGKDPWDYPDNSLVTLCEYCHESEKENFYESSKELLDTLRKSGFLSVDIEDLRQSIHKISDINEHENVSKIINLIRRQSDVKVTSK